MTEEIMFDPTETYSAYKEREAEMQYEEQKYEEFKRKCYDYVAEYFLVNKSELEMCMGDAYINAKGYDETYALSYAELSEISELVDDYIYHMNVVFDKDDNIVSINNEKNEYILEDKEHSCDRDENKNGGDEEDEEEFLPF